MNSLDQLARDAGAEVRDQLATIESPTPDVIARRSRRGRAATGLAAVVVLALAGVGLAVALQDDPAPTRLQVIEDPVPPTTVPANGWVASFNSDTSSLAFYDGAARPEEVLEGTGTQACPAFSPDGERLMFGREDDEGNDSLEVVSVAEDGTASPLSTIPIDGIEDPRYDLPCAIWAPDGRWAALGANGSVWVVDTETAEVRQLPVSEATDLEWRPGTDQLAINGQSWPNPNTPIEIYTLSTGELRTIDGVKAVQFTWSPDGSTIAYSQGVPGAADMMSGISLVNADGTNPRTLTTANWVEQGIGPVWSPRGDMIVYQRERANCTDAACSERSEVVLVTATDEDPENPIGTERVIPPIPNDYYGASGLDPQAWYANSVTWSPDGTELLYSGNPGLLRVPIDPPRPPIVLTGANNLYTDYTTKPWMVLQPWQPVP